MMCETYQYLLHYGMNSSIKCVNLICLVHPKLRYLLLSSSFSNTTVLRSFTCNAHPQMYVINEGQLPGMRCMLSQYWTRAPRAAGY
jgi:hypothetical protein